MSRFVINSYGTRQFAEFEKFHLKKILSSNYWKMENKGLVPQRETNNESTGIQIFKSLTKDQEEIH